MDQRHAQFFRDQMAQLIEREFPSTCRVLEAVPDDGREYRPDDKSRTAWQLATHIATADLWFLDGVINGAYTWDPEAGEKAVAQFQTIADVVAFYKRELPSRLERLRAVPGERLTAELDFFGMMKRPAVTFLGLANNHSVHHRGQLCTYLRAMGSKVPPVYGDSADFPLEMA
jgi:uncharacterized damage-inducible protein DinB